jgi:N-acyl-D-aspartate/D-glutamate deacylase
MSESFDLIIRGGTIVDGSGAPAFTGDVAIRGDRIAAVGKVDGTGNEIDATGKLVTPGFVDIHSHYDGAVIWEDRLMPSSNQGVTTVVMGNCGVGFAPCKRTSQDRLVKLMEGIEDIPEIVLTEGLDWTWETYPEYLDAVEKRPHDINVASYLPHAPLRVYVMGERASAGEIATSEDLAKMAEITREAIKAGALGLATSRNLFHRSSDGHLVPTYDAGEEEIRTICQAMADAGSGLLQVGGGIAAGGMGGDFAMLAKATRETGIPFNIPAGEPHKDPNSWRVLLERVKQENASGHDITLQVMSRALGQLHALQLSSHPISRRPSYMEISHLPIEERVERLKDPALREKIINEEPVSRGDTMTAITQDRLESAWDEMYVITDKFDYEPDPESSIGAQARRLGVRPIELAYDLLLERWREVAFYLPAANYAFGNLDSTLERFREDCVVPGLGDGGAHYGMICDASCPTHMMTHWTRDRARGRMTIPEAVHKQTHASAKSVGLNDRGLLKPGYQADVNIIDYEALTLYAPQVVYDLPGGGRRLFQPTEGYVATIVNGKVVYENGEPTGELPGKLLRGQRPAPAEAREVDAVAV